MKTTIDIPDALFTRARAHARRSGRTLRALVEEGLRRVVDDEVAPSGFALGDHSVGDKGDPNPLESLSWQDLRDEIYGGR
jgi:hypothetical protein